MNRNQKEKILREIENKRNSTSLNTDTSNPLAEKVSNYVALTDFSQEIARPKYDSDINEIIEIVRIINNLAPLRMPIYNFNLEEINGERIYERDGKLLLVREYDNDVIRDYHVSSQGEVNAHVVSFISEHDKNTGILRARIEPAKNNSGHVRTNITIFDTKLNNKYTLMQLSEEGIVTNITEFTGKGKSFQSLFRNIETLKPVRYLEGRDDESRDFFMIDCIFDTKGSVARIRRYNSKRETCIEYTDTKKNIIVKNKQS